MLAGLVQLHSRFFAKDDQRRDFRARDGASRESLFERLKNFVLGRGLFGQQIFLSRSSGGFQQALAQVASNLPGRGSEVEPGRFRKILRFGDAVAALARRLDGQVELDRRKPGRNSVRRVEIVFGHHAHRRVRSATRRDHSCLRHVPLAARQIERWMKIKGGQREGVEIPGL